MASNKQKSFYHDSKVRFVTFFFNLQCSSCYFVMISRFFIAVTFGTAPVLHASKACVKVLRDQCKNFAKRTEIRSKGTGPLLLLLLLTQKFKVKED